VIITAWTAISPYGYGRAAFTDGIRAARRVEPPGVVADFDIEARLGRHASPSMDRTSALAVSTVDMLLAEPGVATDERTGVALESLAGSNATLFEFTEGSVIRRRPHLVNPALLPFSSMNSAAAQCAIWHGLRGPNATLAAGRATLPTMVRYLTRLFRADRASGMVVVGVEEYSEARALLAPYQDSGDALGEGAAALFFAPGNWNRSGLAEVLATGTRLADDEPGEALAATVRAAMAAGGVEPHEVWGVAVSATDAAGYETERKAAGVRVDRVISPGQLIGDTGAAGGAFQLAALLALADGREDARGRVGLVTSVDRTGMVGCVVLRLTGGSEGVS
jgi:3-oxoacyl-[acyl-carrier-protein] synthase II